MTAKTSTALAAVLALVVGSCSGGGSETVTSATSAPARGTVGANATTPLPTSVAATVASVPQAETTAASRNGFDTTPVTPSSPTSVPSASLTSGPPPSTSDPSPPPTPVSTPPPPPTTRTLVDVDCTAARSDTKYDLLHVTVESLPTRYRLTARYSGDSFQHDTLVSFVLGASTYLVTAELFEDGNGVARISGNGLSEAVFLDPPQTITSGLVDLMIRNDQVPDISGTSFDVNASLKVDGSEIETCR